MKEYPDRIYAIDIYRINGEPDFKGGFWNTKPNPMYKGTPAEAVEYIRADLMSKWHKYPEEKPNCDNKYLISYHNNFEDGPYYIVNIGEYISQIGMFCDSDENVLFVEAWMELPEPYKEDYE